MYGMAKATKSFRTMGTPQKQYCDEGGNKQEAAPLFWHYAWVTEVRNPQETHFHVHVGVCTLPC